MEIVAFKRHGNGQSICSRCLLLDYSYPVFWDSMLFDVPGLEGCFCSDCVRAMRADSKQVLPFLSKKGG